MTPYYEDDACTIYHGDCREIIPQLAQVDAIMADPPYYNVLNEVWDRQWKTPAEFLAWLGECADQWRDVLAPNGSLYCFASPAQAARVEVMLADKFQILNSIRWVKPDSILNRAEVASLRSFLSPWEACIFAEQFGADGSALMGSGYDAACSELHAGVFEPMRAYLVGERDAAGWTSRQVDNALGTAGMAGHYFGASQWSLPTEPHYLKMREAFNGGDGQHLRREYEDLRREYEDLRRPFNLERFTSDVWEYDSAPQGSKRTHPAAKPEPMLRRMIEASTKTGAIILDPFMGSGTTLRAAKDLGRKAIGIELDRKYCDIAVKRLAQEVLDFSTISQHPAA